MSTRHALDRQAYQPVPEGGHYDPYVSADDARTEVSIKAIVAGVIFGILFGAANAYLGLQAGLTISTSIPVAVMTVALFRGLQSLGRRGTILEANLSQTIGSASSSVASGIIFTLPAMFMWVREQERSGGAAALQAPGLLQMTLLGLCGGLLGVLFMVPLRRFLIEKEHGHLPYPEGTACAEVLVASEVGGGRARDVFWGLGAGAFLEFLVHWLKIIPGTIKAKLSDALPAGASSRLPVTDHAEVGLKVSAALFGVGYILGPRVASVMVGGGLLSALVIIPGVWLWGRGLTVPYFPETTRLIADMTAGQIWDRYVRYIGAGAVATAGLITLVRSVPTMIESFRIGARQLSAQLSGGALIAPRTQRDLSLPTVAIGVSAIAVVMAVVTPIFPQVHSTPARIVSSILIVIFSFFFVTVASRIVGLVGVTSNPTSGMTIATLLGTSLVFLAMGWTDAGGKATALAVGAVVAIAASISGDTSQDLKTGFLLGATPRRQQVAELVGVLTSAAFVCLTVIMLDRAYQLGSPKLAAPQATLMKLVIDGVLESKLPWMLVGIGVVIAILIELCRLPSLPFSVGVYLPLSTMAPVFLGGGLRWWMERRAKGDEERAQRRERGVLFGSGLVGGQGLMGVVIAGIVGYNAYLLQSGRLTLPAEVKTPPMPFEVTTAWAHRVAETIGLGLTGQGVAMIGGAAVLALLAWTFARRCRG